MEISEANWQKLALKIRHDIFEPSFEYTKRIFLCGADPKNPYSMRGLIADAIISHYYSYYYQIIYPEDVFDDLLYDKQSPNLLFLENLLVENVHSVVIIPESPGSYTELGAFANNDALRQKIVCLIDKKYKNEKSFINLGPIRLIKKEHPGRVIFFDPNNLAGLGAQLRSIVSSIKDPFGSKSDLNLFQMPNFLLPAIYLLEPVDRATLIKLVGYAANDKKNAKTFTVTSLTSLEKKKFIELRDSKYSLTRLGVDGNFKVRGRGPRYNLLDAIRLEVFNMRYRKKVFSI